MSKLNSNIKGYDMTTIKLDHINFKPLRPKNGFDQILNTETFQFEFNFLTEMERKLYITRKTDLDDRLNTLAEYIKIAKINYKTRLFVEPDNSILDGIFSFFTEDYDINKPTFYVHLKNSNGNIEHFGQFQLNDLKWNSENDEISNKFRIGLVYPIYILSMRTINLKIIPLLIHFYYRNKNSLDEKTSVIGLFKCLSHICIA